MRKLLGIVLSVVLLCGAFFLPTKAAGLELPDGGKTTNSGVPYVYGRTSGGEDGYVNIACEIEIVHGATGIADLFNTSKDKAVATLTSDVIGEMLLMISCSVYYTTTDETLDVRVVEQTEYLSSSTFSATATAGNDYAYKGTAGYLMQTDTRGEWLCGTTIEN